MIKSMVIDKIKELIKRHKSYLNKLNKFLTQQEG